MNIQDFPHPFMPVDAGMLDNRAAFDLEAVASVHSFGSEACRLDHFLSPRYRYWCEKLREVPRFHRKQWEWVYICASLHERGLLKPGMRALGFGVGREPLVALFASMGVTVLATDQSPETATQGGWIETGQHSTALAQLNPLGIADASDFAQRVSFRGLDMNAIHADLHDFDFCWSACSFEHLGSIRHGLDFIKQSMRTVKLGGYSIHTTELNLSSDILTYESPDLCLFRKSDFRQLAAELRAAGHSVAPLCFYPGAHPLEQYVDLPPYKGDPHIRLEIGGYATTSFGIIVQRGA